MYASLRAPFDEHTLVLTRSADRVEVNVMRLLIERVGIFLGAVTIAGVLAWLAWGGGFDPLYVWPFVILSTLAIVFFARAVDAPSGRTGLELFGKGLASLASGVWGFWAISGILSFASGQISPQQFSGITWSIAALAGAIVAIAATFASARIRRIGNVLGGVLMLTSPVVALLLGFPPFMSPLPSGVFDLLLGPYPAVPIGVLLIIGSVGAAPVPERPWGTWLRSLVSIAPRKTATAAA